MFYRNPVYLTTLASASDLIGITLSYFMIRWVGARKALQYSFVLSTLGSLLLIISSFYQKLLKDSNSVYVISEVTSYISIVVRLFISAAFNSLYCTNYVFPSQMASQTIGFPNILARFFTIPVVFASRDSEIAPYICVVMSSISAFLTIFLNV